MSDAVERAQSYFLVCAVVSKTIGYVVGPKMLCQEDGGGSEAVDEVDEEEEEESVSNEDHFDEETSLLPRRAQKARDGLENRLKHWARHILSLLPRRFKKELMAPFESPSADMTILCALTGVTLGLVPPLHRAFFNHYTDGGIFNAWLTSSIKNIGMLFTTLQIFAVGCKLGVSFERMRASNESGRIPLAAIVTIFLIRLVIWPA